MPHAKGECRYCGRKLDRRGLVPHEMSHPEYTPRVEGTAKIVKAPRVSRYSTETPQRTVTGHTHQAVRAAHRRMDQNILPAPPEPPIPATPPEIPMAPPEIAAIISGRIRVPRELIMEAYETFSTDPLMFNIYCYFMAPPKDVVDQIINLKTAMQFIDLKIQSLGGWSEEDMKE